MSKIMDVATIHFSVSERGDQGRAEAVRQFGEAAELLNGTGVDLVVTCEGMESIGQTMYEAESAADPGEMLCMYRDFAVRNECTVAGSVKLSEDGKVYNALAFLGPDGRFLGSYKKTFLTEGELRKGLSRGPGATVVETPAGRLGGVICFDLNFDELRDSYRGLKPDILCFSSMFHGAHLSHNWAYQTRSFLTGAVKDGCSFILDPLGRTLNRTTYYNRIAWARINQDRFLMHQDFNRTKFPEIRRKYWKEILIDSDSELGVSILYSCVEGLSAAEVAKEFDLIALDDYLKR